MAGTIKIELVSPERVLLSGEATSVLVPGQEGDFTVFPGHAPFISTLRPGIIDIKQPSGEHRIFVRGGFADVDPAQITILAEHLIDVTRADPAAIAAEVAFAEKLLASATDDAVRLQANDALAALKSLGAAKAA